MVAQKVNKKMRIKQHVVADHNLTKSIEDKAIDELELLQESKAQTIERLLNDDPDIVVQNNASEDESEDEAMAGTLLSSTNTGLAALSMKQAVSIDSRSQSKSAVRRKTVSSFISHSHGSVKAFGKKVANEDLKAYGTIPQSSPRKE